MAIKLTNIKMHLVLLVCLTGMALTIMEEAYSRDTDIGIDSADSRAYYVSAAGSDNNDGSLNRPWRSVDKINTLQLLPGDTVFLKGGDIFRDTISLQSSTAGLPQKPVVITSYGNGSAVIDAGSGGALTLNQSSYISIQNIICKGAGRKTGNTKDGIAVNNCNNIDIQNIEVSGFQKSGVRVYSCAAINVFNIRAYDNGFAGIYVTGEYGDKLHCKNIRISKCEANNNPGDPTELNNHSGNGILAGFCTNVLIEYCSASNNGWDMPRKGNGPVGIWCYEADSVVIQHCISYNNKTSKGGEDGGGYDLDGGVTNSTIQYCLSYGNAGSAFGIFQYAGASPWHDNTIRFCISENDGNISAAHANAYIWNSSHDAAQMKNLLFYNNTLYNNKGAAISYSTESDHAHFEFYNNIFIGANKLITGKDSGNDAFLANNWWSLQGGFNINGFNQFKAWANTTGKEKLETAIVGSNVDLPFKKRGSAAIKDASLLVAFDNYALTNIPLSLQSGIGLQKMYNIQTGNIDFSGKALHKNFIGACAY